jgi:type II secretory ATPase GspE/PulE/Tfp pilus assembly ATPase PilB-like protein
VLSDELRRSTSAGGVPESHRLEDALLEDALRERATDVHLEPQGGGGLVRFRIDGRLLDAVLLTSEEGGRLIRRFKALSGMDTADAFHPADARLTHLVDGREVDLRLATAPAMGGEKLAIRLLERQRVEQRLDVLGLTDEHRRRIQGWLDNICGMFLVSGPTGSGKTTTLYALLHEMRLQERSVVTIEDPVEYQIDGITQIQVDRRRGLTFGDGLRAMLRLDPDYLLLGEVRDADAARAAVEASSTGRVLLSTVHSPDAVGTVTSLRSYGLSDHEIASSLRVVVAQRLVRRLCARCRKSVPVSDADRQWLASAGLSATSKTGWAPAGCDACRGLGYQGRVGVFEVWPLGDDDLEQILNHADERSLRRHLAGRGHATLLDDAWAKATEGTTSIAELKAIGVDYPALAGRKA